MWSNDENRSDVIIGRRSSFVDVFLLPRTNHPKPRCRSTHVGLSVLNDFLTCLQWLSCLNDRHEKLSTGQDLLKSANGADNNGIVSRILLSWTQIIAKLFIFHWKNDSVFQRRIIAHQYLHRPTFQGLCCPDRTRGSKMCDVLIVRQELHTSSTH